MTSMDQNPTSKIRMRYLLATVMAMLLVLGATAGMPHGGMPMGGTPAGAPADPDEAFIEMMIPHHQGAVAMSREIPRHDQASRASAACAQHHPKPGA